MMPDVVATRPYAYTRRHATMLEKGLSREYLSESFMCSWIELRLPDPDVIAARQQPDVQTHRRRLDWRTSMVIAFDTRPRREPDDHRSSTNHASLRPTVTQRSSIRQSPQTRVREFTARDDHPRTNSGLVLIPRSDLRWPVRATERL